MKSHVRTPHIVSVLLFALAWLGSTQTLSACAVPVFRYALENWEPDRLTVAVIHDGEMQAETQTLVQRMETAAYEADQLANLQLHPIDVSAEHPQGSAEAMHADQYRDGELPHMLVYFNNNAPEPQLAWSAPLTAQNVDNLLDSPARREIVERLLDGQSAVWAFIKSGNQADDERALKELQRELARKPDEIELPSLTDLATEEKFNEDLGVEMRVEFSVVVIEPDDAKETFFREMLLNTESDLKDFKDPIAIPIYGRGRTYFALVGPGITADNIADNCNFICGACSCEVKRDNPGQDLLLAANWNQVQPGNWVNDTPLPELTGIGGLAGFEEVVDADVSADDDEAEVTAITTTNPAASDEAPDEKLIAKVELPNSSAASPYTTEIIIEEVADDEPGTPMVKVIGIWIAGLLFVGLCFHFWQRSQNSE